MGNFPGRSFILSSYLIEYSDSQVRTLFGFTLLMITVEKYLKGWLLLRLYYKLFILRCRFFPFWKFACLFMGHIFLHKKILGEDVSWVPRSIAVRRNRMFFTHTTWWGKLGEFFSLVPFFLFVLFSLLLLSLCFRIIDSSRISVAIQCPFIS